MTNPKSFDNNGMCPVCYSQMEQKHLFTSLYWYCKKCEDPKKDNDKNVPYVTLEELDNFDWNNFPTSKFSYCEWCKFIHEADKHK